MARPLQPRRAAIAGHVHGDEVEVLRQCVVQLTPARAADVVVEEEHVRPRAALHVGHGAGGQVESMKFNRRSGCAHAYSHPEAPDRDIVPCAGLELNRDGSEAQVRRELRFRSLRLTTAIALGGGSEVSPVPIQRVPTADFVAMSASSSTAGPKSAQNSGKIHRETP